MYRYRWRRLHVRVQVQTSVGTAACSRPITAATPPSAEINALDITIPLISGGDKQARGVGVGVGGSAAVPLDHEIG